MDSDNRFFKRFVVAGTIMVSPDVYDQVRTVKGELIDLSFKGGGFYSREQLRNGERVLFLLVNDEMGIRLRGTAKIVCVSRSQRNSETIFRYGITFSNLDSEALRDIVLGLEKRAKESPYNPF